MANGRFPAYWGYPFIFIFTHRRHKEENLKILNATRTLSRWKRCVVYLK